MPSSTHCSSWKLKLQDVSEPLLVNLLVTQVEVDVLVDVIDGAQRQPVMRTGVTLGQLDVVSVDLVDLTVVVAVGALHGHVLSDLALHGHGCSSWALAIKA